MKLKKLICELLVGAALANPLARGCEELTNQSLSVLLPAIPDVRGTWYENGKRNGWYGPDKEYEFSFWSLKQEGTNVWGVYQSELSNRSKEITGTITNNILKLSLALSNGELHCMSTNGIKRDLELLVYGDEGGGKNTLDGSSNYSVIKFQRVSTNYQERVPPKKRKY